MIIVCVNAIIKKVLDFQNNHSIPLTLYYRDNGLKIKDINVIILIPKIIHNIEYYK